MKYITFSVEIRDQKYLLDSNSASVNSEIAIPEYLPYNCIDTGKIFEYLMRSAEEEYEKTAEENNKQ